MVQRYAFFLIYKVFSAHIHDIRNFCCKFAVPFWAIAIARTGSDLLGMSSFLFFQHKNN